MMKEKVGLAMDSPKPEAPNSFHFDTTYEKQSNRATATINRPKVLNCLDFHPLRELYRAFEDVSWDDNIRVLALTGADELKGFTGIDDPYEAPLKLAIVLDAAKVKAEEAAVKLIELLEKHVKITGLKS